MIIVATGHRPDKLGGYNCETINELAELARKYIIEHKPEKVITGMAQGWDTAVAMACVSLKVKFTAAVPYVGQERTWPEDAQKQYRELLKKAKAVHVVSPGGYVPWKYLKRNQWMVDNGTHVLALWNGDQKGGTWHCIKYARQQGKPITNLWKAWEIAF